jgi:hypothetical protein
MRPDDDDAGMSEDEPAWRPRIDDPKPIRPPRQMPPLQPFFELTARHGRPRGPFEQQLVDGLRNVP